MNMHSIRITLVFLMLILTVSTSTASTESQRLAIIKARGELIVGVKADYPPWGYYNDNGDIIGLEPDLAKNIADKLGVNVRLKKVTASNRIGRLEDGSIDLLIATMSDTMPRRRQTGIIEPSYYSSGATIIVPKETPLKSWAELYGRSVCLTKNAYFNRDLTERFLLKPKAFEGTLDNLAALQYGRCFGWIYDDTALVKLLQEPRWQNFKTPLHTVMVNPWAIAVQSTEQYSEFGLLISDAIIDWHRTGKLLELETKWGIPNSHFLLEQHQRWKTKDFNGNYACKRLDDHRYPAGCLSRHSIGATTAVHDSLLSNWGINFPPMYDDYSRKSLLKGIGLTLLLSLLAIVGSLTFGSLMGIALFKLPPVLLWPINRLNDIFRMTPPLLNLYIVFFGLGGLAAYHYGLQFDAVAIAVIVFSLYAGSSNAVLMCQALQAVHKHHPEKPTRALFAIAFPQAYEGINANSVNIVKAVGLASMIAVPELISASNSIIAEYGNPTEMMTFLLVFYFFIVYIFIFLLNRLQQWVGARHA